MDSAAVFLRFAARQADGPAQDRLRGRRVVGWGGLRVSGKSGTAVRLRFAEILTPDGHIYRDRLREAEATDTYTCKGGGEEVFEPHFTYHGFRFVEITGFPGTPNLTT